jgi:predicted acyl esterase
MRFVPVLLFAFTAATAQDSSQFTRHDVMIPARDGVKLHTVIFTPKIFTANAAPRALPILLERTPYGARSTERALLAAYRHLAADGYIFAFQDIRGRFTSEGQFVMQRQVRDQADPKAIDEAPTLTTPSNGCSTTFPATTAA